MIYDRILAVFLPHSYRILTVYGRISIQYSRKSSTWFTRRIYMLYDRIRAAFFHLGTHGVFIELQRAICTFLSYVQMGKNGTYTAVKHLNTVRKPGR